MGTVTSGFIGNVCILRTLRWNGIVDNANICN